jgi:hypothetical protein
MAQGAELGGVGLERSLDLEVAFAEQDPHEDRQSGRQGRAHRLPVGATLVALDADALSGAERLHRGALVVQLAEERPHIPRTDPFLVEGLHHRARVHAGVLAQRPFPASGVPPDEERRMLAGLLGMVHPQQDLDQVGRGEPAAGLGLPLVLDRVKVLPQVDPIPAGTAREDLVAIVLRIRADAAALGWGLRCRTDGFLHDSGAGDGAVSPDAGSGSMAKSRRFRFGAPSGTAQKTGEPRLRRAVPIAVGIGIGIGIGIARHPGSIPIPMPIPTPIPMSRGSKLGAREWLVRTLASPVLPGGVPPAGAMAPDLYIGPNWQPAVAKLEVLARPLPFPGVSTSNRRSALPPATDGVPKSDTVLARR